jgi:hypothetical protein
LRIHCIGLRRAGKQGYRNSQPENLLRHDPLRVIVNIDDCSVAGSTGKKISLFV